MFAGSARRGAGWLLSVFGLGALRRWRRVALLAALLSIAALPGRPGLVSAQQARAAELPGVEDAGARTQHSQTFAADDGRRVSRVFAGSVNYLDGVGRWQPIDNTLRLEDGVIRNGANRYTATLPTDLGSGEVTVQKDRDWVSFAPRADDTRAAAAAKLDGPQARYEGIWPGVQIVYTAVSDALREELVVADATSAQDFAFDLHASGELRPVAVPSGAIEFRDETGAVKLAIPASLMWDAKGERHPVRVSLAAAKQGWTLTLVPDREWLAAEGRAWPVTIDPQVSVDANPDCSIFNTYPTTNFCGDDSLFVGESVGQGHHWRSVLRFDVQAALPPGTDVRDAELNLSLLSGGGQDIGVSRVTRAWDEYVTWQSPWTTDGGDFVDEPESVEDGSSGWDVTEMVRDWASGGRANRGLILHEVVEEATSGSPAIFASSEAGSSTAPYLEITHEPRGVRRGYAWDSYHLTDRSSMAVNLADGNLLVRSQDLSVTGTGLDLGLTRYFNSQDGEIGELGTGGRFSLGRDIELDECDLSGHPDSRCMTTAGGIHVHFERTSSTGFDSPPSMNATLKEETDGTFTLTANQDGTKLHFASGAQSYMTSIEDRHGNLIDPDYVTGTNGHLSKLTDTQGREFDVSANTNGDITAITDDNITPGGAVDRTWTYAYQTGTRRLASVTDPAGSTTSYGYDTSGRLVTITDPNGTAVTIAYDTRLRVTSITRPSTTNSADNAVTTYAYSSDPDGICANYDGQTLLTDPRGKVAKYCWDERGRIRRSEDADGNRRSRTYTPNDDVTNYTELEGAAAKSFDFAYATSSNRLAGGNSPAGESFDVGYCGQTGEPSCASSYEKQDYQPTSVKRVDGSDRYMSYNATGDLTRLGGSSGTGAADAVKLDYRDGSGGGPDDGQLKSSQDGNGHQTDYTYDADGNLLEIDPPGTQIKPTTFTVDGVSRIASVRDGNHDSGTTKQIKTMYYDGVDRVTRVDYGDDSRFEYTYDANGNMTKREDFAAPLTNTTPAHTTNYTYDKRNQRTTESYDPGTAFTAYAWDKAGNLLSLQDAGGTVAYGYDDINRVTSITQPGSVVIGVSHDDDARRTTITYPGGLVHRTQADKSGKTASITIDAGNAGSDSDDIRKLDYDYRNNPCASGTTGQHTQVQRLVDDNHQAGTVRQTCYTYDLLDRLDEVETKNGSTGSGSLVDRWEYDQDPASNRIYKKHTDGSGSTENSWAYGLANDLCWRSSGDQRPGGAAGSAPDCASPPSGATDYDYDESGNEYDEAGGRTASYDIRNRMTELNSNPLEYRSATNADLIGWDGETYLNNLLGFGARDATTYTHTPDGGATLAQRNSAGTQYLLADRLGSTIGLITATSTDVDRTYSYDPDGSAMSTGSGATTEIRYTGGHVIDGLYHFGARFYDPDNARWIQQDPLNAPGDLKNANRYLYAGGDPINSIDPQGTISLSSVANIVSIGATVGGIACTALTAGVGALACGLGTAAVGTVAGVVASSGSQSAAGQISGVGGSFASAAGGGCVAAAAVSTAIVKNPTPGLDACAAGGSYVGLALAPFGIAQK